MKARTMIKSALKRVQGTRVSTDRPVMIAMPSHDDQAKVLRSMINSGRGVYAGMMGPDRAELLTALDRMITSAPEIAELVIIAGSGGLSAQHRAKVALAGYAAHGVALAPHLV